MQNFMGFVKFYVYVSCLVTLFAAYTACRAVYLFYALYVELEMWLDILIGNVL